MATYAMRAACLQSHPRIRASCRARSWRQSGLRADSDGNGKVIGTELVEANAARTRANLDAAGLAALEGEEEIDTGLLDGVFILYLDLIKLLEPWLKKGALVIAKNGFRQAGGYVDYVSEPSNGHVTLELPFDKVRGNVLSVRTI
ncbi:hypothetical protein B0T26DRAFT_871504 [Lasiosphaeria miniovina]|uniref:O-methyltransferase n=1 Tax=Lasiosphaeria miniovina TaxID=1954250 RepID=A0AA40AJ78_9PEZI|nr:uncharacterized protein B0T26DRAFT_871504 [Lasiosphaeria miniovina]KAK0716876.1 hypothetical protein B0T26DRAFT_871504 [Lasiosphaeria miniovina]